MYWFTARDGTRFLVQNPEECARSLARAFPRASTPVTSRRFMRTVLKECPLPPSAAVPARPPPG